MREPSFAGLAGVPSRVAWIYTAGAGAWIVLSDLAVALAFGSDTAELWSNIAKGLLFVAASAGLLYVGLRRNLNREATIRRDLEATHERFNSAVTHLPFTFAIYDADRRFRFLNTMGLLTANKPLDEVLGRRDEEVFPLEMVNAYLPVLNRALETRQPQSEVVDVALPSGHVHLAYTFTPLLNADGSVREVLGVTNDMTVVVRNERRVRRLNRTLSAISAANSVLVRSTDEAVLLQEFCTELAAHTGHGLAWVGLVEPDGRLHLAAWAGRANGFLDGMPLPCCGTPVTCGAAITAIQGGQPLICRDFQVDEKFAACRERAQAAGLRSAVVLPLCAAGKAFGELSLYSAEPDRFDDDEVKLLTELADDLAFGMTALRQKQELTQALVRLRESEERLRTLKLVIDQSPSVAYVARTEPGWPVEFVSDNVARFGYQPAEFTAGQISFPSIMHPEDLARVAAEGEQALAEGKPEFTQEYRIFDARGQTLWMRDFCTVTRNAAGQATHFRGLITDITEQRRAEELLAATLSRYHRLLEQAEDGIALVDAAGRFVEVNPAACRLYGRPLADLLALNLADTYAPEERALLPARLQAAMAGETFRTERQLTRPDGTTVEVEVNWGPVDGTLVQGVIRDITERKRADDELRWKTAFFEAQVNSAIDGILVVDSQGRQVLKNSRFNEVWKIPRAIAEDMDDRKSLEFATSQTRHPTQFAEKVAHLYAHPAETSRDEVELVDGTVLDRYSAPVQDGHGKLYGRIWTFRDITAQKQAGNQVRDALAYLGTVIEASPAGIISYDETGQAKTANAAAAQITGGTVEQLLSLNFRQIKSWQASGLLAAAERALERHQPEQLEAHFTTTFGKEIWVALQFVPFQRGEGWHLLLLISDIAEQIRTTAQLRLQGAALDAAANAIVITDAQGTILWVNPAFTKSTGYSLAEAVGQNPRLLKSGRHPREFYAGMWKTILAGHHWHGELCNRRKDGELCHEEMTIAPVRDSAGRVTHFIAIKQDITERRLLEKQFLRAQRLEGIGLLAGGIAHDLNNVLAPILMGADLLRLQSHNQQTIQQLDGIVQSAQRGADIVKQVLTFARGIEGERIALQPKHIIKEMVRMARETFPPNLQVRVDVPNDLWSVTGDPTQLHQVLLNLSVNARDAMPDGGELSYSARNVTVDAPFAQANPGAKPGPHVVLCVQDTGTGIPPEVLDRMFEPFFTTKELGKGTGLGLSTVLGIVRSHGGFVTVASQPGRGTTFEVYVPASPQPASAAPPAQPAPVPAGEGELVLVVDDEADLLRVTRAMLEHHGYRVLTANDGTIALTELSQHLGGVKLVITDIMMPFMDGVQLIRAVRRLAPDLGIIASSGALGLPGQKDRAAEVHALGVKHILLKPYSVESLLRLVHEELHPKPPAA